MLDYEKKYFGLCTISFECTCILFTVLWEFIAITVQIHFRVERLHFLKKLCTFGIIENMKIHGKLQQVMSNILILEIVF